MVAGCSGRVDLGGSSTSGAGSSDAGALTTGSGGGSSGSGGAATGGKGTGGIENASGGATTGPKDGAAGTSGGSSGGAPTSGGASSGGTAENGGASSGGIIESGGASGVGGSVIDSGATGGATGSGGESSDGATATGGTSSGGASPDATASSGLGATCGYNWDCIVNAPGCDMTLGGCACDASSHVCVASHCVDGRRDGTESDVDCGGECAGCGVGKVCYHDADCSLDASGCDQCACDRLTSACVINHCADHRLDVDETDLDCGGAKCRGCDLGKVCKVDSDCAYRGCDTVTRTCTSPCYDHHTDGLETDVDCGGPDGCAACNVGQHCLSNFDCVSGHFCNTSKVCQ